MLNKSIMMQLLKRSKNPRLVKRAMSSIGGNRQQMEEATRWDFGV